MKDTTLKSTKVQNVQNHGQQTDILITEWHDLLKADVSLGSTSQLRKLQSNAYEVNIFCNETYVYMLEYSFDNIPMLLSSLPNPLQPVTHTPTWVFQGIFIERPYTDKNFLLKSIWAPKCTNWPSTDCRRCASSKLNMDDTTSSVHFPPPYTISTPHPHLHMSRVATCPSQTEWDTPPLFTSITQKFTNEMDDYRNLIMH